MIDYIDINGGSCLTCKHFVKCYVNDRLITPTKIYIPTREWLEQRCLFYQEMTEFDTDDLLDSDMRYKNDIKRD